MKYMVYINSFSDEGKNAMTVINSVHAKKDNWVSEVQSDNKGSHLKVTCTSSRFSGNDHYASYGITVVIDTSN